MSQLMHSCFSSLDHCCSCSTYPKAKSSESTPFFFPDCWFVGWFVSRIKQKLLNLGTQNMDGGWSFSLFVQAVSRQIVWGDH